MGYGIRKHGKVLLGFILVTLVAIPLSAAPSSSSPLELRTPKPANWRPCTEAEFQIDLARVDARNQDLLYGSKEGLRKLARFYTEDPEGKKLWAIKQKNLADLVNEWYFSQKKFQIYVYKCFKLDYFAINYLLTGHQLLGQFLHDHTMQIARLPEDFWLHKDLRYYKPERPYGMIETGQICRSLCGVLDMAGDLFTEAEINEVKVALHQKGVIPMLNYQEDTKTKSNFICIVGIGTYVTGKYLGDPKVCEVGKNTLLRYVNDSIEDDGSYGEGFGYFSFPMDALVYAVAAMSPEEQKDFFEKSGLRHSAEWLAYPYLYSTVPGNHKLMCVFADNSYVGLPARTFLAMISDVYHDPVATWLGKKFTVTAKKNWQCTSWAWTLNHFSNDNSAPPEKPSISQLPLIRGFENGENFIRSSWKSDSTVLALYTAGPTRVNYNHQRPERNSINLGAYGEYIIVSPHSASYRSPIHDEYDRSTLSANTIRIDNTDQLTANRPAWGLKNPPYANPGKPVAKLARLESNPDFEVLAGDARLCYKEKLKDALRTVLYRRSQDYFVIVDRLEDKEGKPHTYTALWHFNNRDDELKLAGVDSADLLVERPRADLAIFTGADCELKRTITDGYMHGEKRDYFPGGKFEGKLGSAKVLNVFNADPQVAITFITVLQPVRKGDTPKPVSLKDGKLTVGEDTWIIENNRIQLGNSSVPLTSE